MEIWDLYDEQGNKTGETWERSRAQEIPEGRYHIVCDILIRHRDGDFLLTLRDSGKDMYPGCWEASAGGSALAGETPEEGARREMLEETGLKAEKLELISITQKPETRSTVYAFIAAVDCAKNSVVLQEGETVDFQWIDSSAFLRLTREEPVLAIQYPRYKPYLDQLCRVEKSCMNCRIRTAVPADEGKIRDLFLEMLRTIYRTEDVKGYPDGYLERFWSKSEDRIYVADVDGEAVGFLSVEVHHDPVDHIYLDDFSVTLAYRNKGIGSALICAAEAYAGETGSRAIILHVEKTNTTAMRLYEQSGYSVFRDDGNRFLLKKDIE